MQIAYFIHPIQTTCKCILIVHVNGSHMLVVDKFIIPRDMALDTAGNVHIAVLSSRVLCIAHIVQSLRHTSRIVCARVCSQIYDVCLDYENTTCQF